MPKGSFGSLGLILQVAWVLGINLGSSRGAASSCKLWAISPDPLPFFSVYIFSILWKPYTCIQCMLYTYTHVCTHRHRHTFAPNPMLPNIYPWKWPLSRLYSAGENLCLVLKIWSDTKAEEVIGPRFDVASLNEDVVNLPSKYSCFHPQIHDQRSFLLQWVALPAAPSCTNA